jgi:type IV pilus assembly protein PilY1
MNTKYLFAVAILLVGAAASNPSRAQATTFAEDFTGAGTANSWYFFNGACLTAGSSSSGTNPGVIPGCTSVLSSYYALQSDHDAALTGGNSGFLGSTAAPSSPDPIGSGALRFTNGAPYGHNERGAILSSNTIPSNQGIQVTFKTVTYHGDSGGPGGDGADGISFFLMDGSKPPGLGATGGSLAYSCSNNNANYDGLNGGYIGLGIDEFGNFLNGANLVAGYTGTNVATGDNSAYGYGYKPGRIGLRGAGSVSWAALNGAYGANPSSSILPYYPASLTTSCANAGGVYSAATNNCVDICSAGSTYYAAGNICNKACATGGTYVSGTDTCDSCTSVSGTYNSGSNQCINTNKCLTGTTYYSGTSTCDSCPATGYATGTYSNGQCTNSCPTGSSAPTSTTCMPAGSVYSTGFYCPTGSTIVSNSGTYVCYTAGLSYSAGYYCPTGQTIVAGSAVCYTTALSHGGTFNCPTGQTISASPYSYCYPSTATSTSAPKYCAVGYTLQSTTLCYPTGLASASRSTTNYCPTNQTITGTSCYPTGNVYGAGYSCPSGDTAPTSAAKCCPTGYTVSGSNCTKTASTTIPATTAAAVTASAAMTTSLTMTGSTADGAATAATAALAVTAAQTVTANSTATQITSPTTAAPSTLAPTTGNVDALYAVQNTCKTGILYNYSTPAAPSSAGPATLANAANTAGILDYAPIANAYKELTSFQIANEGATTRGAATPIFYNLKITNTGLLSLSYSVSGGAYSFLINNQSITSTQGLPPATYRVGFAGSTGGDTNIHEIMCFKASSNAQSGSSASVNEKQAAKVQAGTQAYFAYYDPSDWTGNLTANSLIANPDGTVSVSAAANWDASCVLSGTASGTPASGGGCANTGASGPSSPTPAPAGRIMLTWDTANNVGIPFEWANLNAAQQAALTAGDATPNNNRLNYLRGDRTNEINSVGVGLFRQRDSILGDIVDSSPTWVGPPSSSYTAAWRDRLYPTTVMPENSGSQSYVQFVGAEQTRLNVVYAGSNDGFLHGFRAGGFDSNGNFTTTSTPNDGQEVLSYMPGSTLVSAAASGATGGCTNDSTTGTVVQQIHGASPAINPNAACVEPTLDYTNSQYGHNFFVDATPGTGDLYFAGQWHTWLVGGLGAGGAAIYALDVTNPSNFTETNASNIVAGEWNAGSITCTNVPSCGNNLGNTFGTPLIKRLHNGNWGVIFGNGFGSQTGDAGIYVMSIDINTGATTFYYLSTKTAGGNGIAYVAAADLDGDHITDYVYAGDLNGNVWRFDLTSNVATNWAAGSSPLFTTQSGQPITTQVLVISAIVAGGPHLLIEFGTGQLTQLTNLGPEQYASAGQSLYGVWDWNMSAWNALAPSQAYSSLQTTPTNTTGLTTPYTLSSSNLQAQTLTPSAATAGVVDGTNVVVCWQGSTTCTSGNTMFGWFANLPGGTPNATPGAAEQIVFNPVYFQNAILVNSTVPGANVATSCSNNQDIDFTYILNVVNGGVFPNTFPIDPLNGTALTDPSAAGTETNASGSVSIVTGANSSGKGSKVNIVYSKKDGTKGSLWIQVPSNTKAQRLTWIEKR